MKTQRRVRRIVPVAHTQDLQPLRQLTLPVAAQVSTCFMQRPNVEAETPKQKILNSAPVTTNEALNSTCKYSVNHIPHIHHIETAQDNRIILSKGSKLENQHTTAKFETFFEYQYNQT